MKSIILILTLLTVLVAGGCDPGGSAGFQVESATWEPADADSSDKTEVQPVIYDETWGGIKEHFHDDD